MHRAKSLAIAEILHKAENHQCSSDQRKHIGMLKAGQRADDSDDCAGGGDHGEAERIDFAALNERGKTFSIDTIGHGIGSLLGSK